MAEISTRQIGGCTVDLNRRMALEGVAVYLLGLLLPAVLTPNLLHIYRNISSALLTDSEALILTAALKLVLTNVARMVPHYLGAFMINESIHIRRGKRRLFLFNILMTYLLIYLMYRMINAVYPVQLDFGIPAILTIAFTLYLSYLDLFEVKMLDKGILLFSLLMSIQWLDTVPGLTGHGFGRGEVSEDIKMASQLLDDGRALSLFAWCMMTVFGFMAVIQIRLLVGEHRRKLDNEERVKMQKHLYETQIEAMKMRNTSEAQNLVHDLKSPLTTVQGLVSLAQMMEDNPLIREYFEKITISLNSMSTMISEILYENREQVITVKELMRTVLAQVSVRIPREMLLFADSCEQFRIRCNKIRFTRAIVNLIDNARYAVDPEKGKIALTAEEREGRIRISVTDDGCGMTEEQMKHIFEVGYSGRGSSGMGLAFVKQVVEHSGGVLEITSRPGGGTRAVIIIKEAEDDGDSKEDPGDR